MRGRRRTPAGGVQAEKQQRYAQLIAAGGQQRGGVQAGRDQPQDRHSLAVWPASPEFRRGTRALSAGADQASQAA